MEIKNDFLDSIKEIKNNERDKQLLRWTKSDIKTYEEEIETKEKEIEDGHNEEFLIIKKLREINEDNYEDVAKVALGGETYAKMVADAYKFVGPEGTVAFMKEDRKDVVLECADGVTIDKSEFKIIPLKEPRELFDCPVVFIYEKIICSIFSFSDMCMFHWNSSSECKATRVL